MPVAGGLVGIIILRGSVVRCHFGLSIAASPAGVHLALGVACGLVGIADS